MLCWTGAFCLVLALHVGIALAMLGRSDQVSAPPAPPALIMVDLPIDVILPTADSVESVASQLVVEVAPNETVEAVKPAEIVEENVEEATPLIEAVVARAHAETEPTETTETREFARPVHDRSEEPLTDVRPKIIVAGGSPGSETETVESFTPAEIAKTGTTVADLLPTETITAEPVIEPPTPREQPPNAVQAASKGSMNSKASSGAGRPNPQVLARYLSEVRATILKHRGSVRSDASGQVVIRAVIDRSGRLTGIKVVRSSGLPILDAAALDVVRRVDRVPVIPQDVGRTSIPLNIPFRFSGG